MRFLALALLGLGCNTDVCNGITTDVGNLCLPDTVAAGQPTIIEVQESCGHGCTDSPSCTAYLRNGQMVLDVEEQQCSSQQTVDCYQVTCLRRTARCALPGLPAGDYTLLAPGTGPRYLRVREGGNASCTLALPDGGVP